MDANTGWSDSDFEVLAPRPAPPLAGPLLLGLFMLMLAVFIILVGYSTVAEQRAREVLLAMTETFRPTATFHVVAPAEDQGPGTGNFPALGRIVQVGIPSARAEGAPSATRLRLGIATAALFGRTRGTILEPSAKTLLADLARALAAAPDGQRFDVEYLIGHGRDADNALATARAAVVAEALIAAGAPRGGVSVGLIPSPMDQSSIVFNVRPADNGRTVR